MAESLGAKAFTLGNNIALGASGSFADQKLLGHELAHVVQQRSMGGDAMQPKQVQRQENSPKPGLPNRVQDLAGFFSSNCFDGKDASSDTAYDRMQRILKATEHWAVPGLKTGGIVDGWHDEGFGGLFKDPHESSDNQVGHFLTAVNLGLHPDFVSKPNEKVISTWSMLRGITPTVVPLPLVTNIRDMLAVPASVSDEEVAIRLMVGHEKTPDLSITEPLAFWTQYNAATNEDVQTFKQANAALGENPKELKLGAALEILKPKENEDGTTTGGIAVNSDQKGNSYQDLLLSLAGWRLGGDIRRGKFNARQDVADWIQTNLSQ